MDILNNILDKAHNYLILLEARNTGLIAINLGVISFYYSSKGDLKIFVLLLCFLGIMLLTMSFIKFKHKVISKSFQLEQNSGDELQGAGAGAAERETLDDKPVVKDRNDILGIGSIGIRRVENNKVNTAIVIPQEHLEKNIYNIKNISDLTSSEYLNLVSEKIEVKGDKLLNHIKKEYRFTPASRDLAEEILDTARNCRFKEKIFYIGLYIFMGDVILLLIDNIIL